MPLPGGGIVAGRIPLDVFPHVVRVVHEHDARQRFPDVWPELRPDHAALRLCDVLDRPIKFTASPPEQQVHALVAALGWDERVSALVADTERHRDFVAAAPLVPSHLVEPGTAVSYRLLPRITEDQAVELLGYRRLSHLWSSTWLVRVHEWAEEHSLLVAGDATIRDTLAERGLRFLDVSSDTPWPPKCRNPQRHLLP